MSTLPGTASPQPIGMRSGDKAISQALHLVAELGRVTSAVPAAAMPNGRCRGALRPCRSGQRTFDELLPCWPGRVKTDAATPAPEGSGSYVNFFSPHRAASTAPIARGSHISQHVSHEHYTSWRLPQHGHVVLIKDTPGAFHAVLIGVRDDRPLPAAGADGFFELTVEL